jgi:hypothetical protein
VSRWSDVALARSGIVGAWRLGDTSGTTAVDAAGTPHNGTYAGGFTLNRGGIWVPSYSYEGTAQFDGTSGKVTVADNAALNLTTFSASIFFYPTAAAGASVYRVLFGKNNGLGSAGWSIALYNGLNLVAFAPGNLGATSTPLVTLNKWHLAQLTYDGTLAAGSQVATLYLDGKQVAQATNRTWAATSAALFIGSGGASTQWFQGLLQEAFLYNRVLTAAELAQDVAALQVTAGRQVHRWQQFNAPAGPRAVLKADVDYTAQPTDSLILYTALTAPRTVTMPSWALFDGQSIEVADVSGAAGANNITIANATNGGTISTNYGRAVMRWTGSAWVRVA